MRARAFLAACLAASTLAGAAGHDGATPPAAMAYVPAGNYLPLYRPSELNPNEKQGSAADVSEPVEAFYLDIYPVTNEQYLEFVRTEPRWQRSRVASLFADEGYLQTWAGDDTLGPRAPLSSVVGVSWFAARAYCKAQGKRLPSTAEWEYAAAPVETGAGGRLDPGFATRILEWYARPASDVLPPAGSVYRNRWGIHDLHGLVWEWTRDFNTALSPASRAGMQGSTASSSAVPPRLGQVMSTIMRHSCALRSETGCAEIMRSVASASAARALPDKKPGETR